MNQLMFCFYGDDFTGSTDAMEALALNGVKTVLFLEPPSQELLETKFKHIEAYGVAGISRALTPEQMEAELSTVFQTMAASGAKLVHYKTCSTFDSSPEVGSIGKAIDLASEIFRESRFIPLLVGSPNLKRYTVFGNHYATVDEQTYRLDRHPVMAKHPITPMDEADLRVHLSKQTDQQIGLVDIVDLSGDEASVRSALERELAAKADIILFDALDESRLAVVGQLMWEEAKQAPMFAVGSSGVESALTAYWQQSGQTSTEQVQLPDVQQSEQLLVLSGSCSPVTEEQIRHALEHGFSGIKVPGHELVDDALVDETVERLIEQAKEMLKNGESVVLYTALGPDDASIEKTRQALEAGGRDTTETGDRIGSKLGEICRELIASCNLTRVLCAGGDTSGYTVKQLGIYGLETLAPTVPGVPLCRGYSEHDAFDGLQIALKGGQMGGKDFFSKVKNLIVS